MTRIKKKELNINIIISTNEVPCSIRSRSSLRQEGHQYFRAHLDANDIKTVLGGVQAAFNDEDINRVIASCKGKPIHQLINDGAGKISGGCSAPVATGKPQKETKKEEPKKEEPKKK